MSRGKYLFRQTEALRLFRAAQAAGLTPKAIRVNAQGYLELELGDPLPAAAAADAAVADEWKVWGDQ
jgi:hypothetical protein